MSMKTFAPAATGPLFAALLAAAAPNAAAHSYIAARPLVIYPIFAQYRIVHACYPLNGTTVKPVIAHSFLMPTVNPILSRPDGGTIEDTDKNGKVELIDIIQSGGLQENIVPFVNHSVFKELQRKTDPLGNTIGFSGTEGNVPDKYWADIPFTIMPVFFNPDSCVSELVVHPVGADICRLTGVPDYGDANLWMEHPTAKFPNYVHGIGENGLSIDFKRSKKYNPMKKRCGAGYKVDVFASDEDIDANLPIPGIWPKP
ncbi:MAG: hypothetical protein U1E83_04170 [Methylotetracoccus sp.]